MTQEQLLLILNIIELVVVIFLVIEDRKNDKKKEEKNEVTEAVSVNEENSFVEEDDGDGNDADINYDSDLKVYFPYNSKDGERMVLDPPTKESYVRLHRDMWRWIAEMEGIIENESEEASREALKDIWLHEHKFPLDDVINANCFCCEYAKRQREKFIEIVHEEKIKVPPVISKLTKDDSDYCIFCPLNWSIVKGREKCDINKLSTDSFLCNRVNGYYDYNDDDASIIAELPMLKVASAEEWIQAIKEGKV